MDRLISIDSAVYAARTLKQYCEQNGQQINAIECFITKYNLLIPAGVKAQQAAEPAPAVPQQYCGQYQQQAPAPVPPPVPDNLPPDPFAGMPFSLY